MENTEIDLVVTARRPTRVKTNTILYVDDEESNLRIFRMAFKRHYNVLTAVNGYEAIETLRANDIQLIITDQKMPEMTGTELLEKLLPEFPDVIRIILTGFADIEAIVKAVNRCGIYKYITKPWDKGEMKLTIDKALESYELKKEKTSLVTKLEEMNANLEDKVEERTRELEEANRRMTDSIHYAHTIQNTLLPKIEVMKESFEDCFVLYRPLDIVSGDFYWYRRVQDGDNDLTFVASVDCTGHGVPGALMSMLGESMLKHIVLDKKMYDSAAIVNELNVEIEELLNQHDEENHHGMDISLVVVDHLNRKISFSGARQDLVVIKKGELETIKGERFSIGGFAEETKEAQRHSINLDNQLTFYLFSDGFKDQFGGTDFKKFGPARLKNLLLEISTEPMKKQQEILERTLDEWVGDEVRIDDVLLMGFTINP